jgi:hypothetical protein
MKRIGIAVLSAASLLAAGTVAAAEPQWTYGQIGWIQGDGADNDGQSDGYKIDASVGFLRNYHFQLSYEDGDIDSSGFLSNDVDWDGYRATLGWHSGINDSSSTQIVTNISYFDLDYDEDGGSNSKLGSTDGFGLGFGVRSMLSDRVEVEAMINWTDGTFDPGSSGGYDEDFTDTNLSLTGRYHWTSAFSTGVTLNINGNNSDYGPLATAGVISGDSAVIDLRYSFGDFF